MTVILIWSFVALLALLGSYDCACLVKIYLSLPPRAMAEYINSADRWTARKPFGAIWLWHRKYKHIKYETTPGAPK